MRLAVNVGAILLDYIALITILNGMIGGMGSWFSLENLSLEQILGYIFALIAYILGVPVSKILTADSLIEQKLVVNEFVDYIDFVAIKDTLSLHTRALMTFALCGFANLSSIAILLGAGWSGQHGIFTPQRCRPNGLQGRCCGLSLQLDEYLYCRYLSSSVIQTK